MFHLSQQVEICSKGSRLQPRFVFYAIHHIYNLYPLFTVRHKLIDFSYFYHLLLFVLELVDSVWDIFSALFILRHEKGEINFACVQVGNHEVRIGSL